VNTIECKDLTKKLGTFTAVNNISLEVKEGEIFGFLGANGAGKTTAIKMFTGLLEPTSGMGKVAGYDIFKQREQIKKSIGYMSQKFSLYDDLTVYENLEFFGGVYGISRKEIKLKLKQYLNDLNLTGIENKLVRELPLGWKQKIAFSAAIAHEPKIVFLDEPTGGVDPKMRRQFWDLIYKKAEEGTTVFITTHYMDEAEYCDRLSIMVDGVISAMGKPTELKQNYSVKTINDLFMILAEQF
jgi:ABC-2 type transport system ATP-binding protein